MTQLPAYIGNRQGRSLAQDAISGLGGAQPPHISIAKQRFTLVDAAGNEKMQDTLYLDVVVVDINKSVSKIYYEGVFDPTAQEYKPPVCFSDNGIGASAQAIMPQSVSCQLCPHNMWGSDTSRVTGKATKSCNDAKKVAVIIPGSDDEIVYMLRIPPATLKVWKTYVQSVCSHPLPGSNPPRKMELFDFVTRITFDKDTQGVLNFSPCPDPWYDEQDSGLIDKIFAENRTDALVGRTDVVVTADRVQPNAAGPRAVEAPKPQMAPPPAAPQQAPVQQLNAPQAAPRRRGRPPKSDAGASPPPATAPAQPQGHAGPTEDLEIPPFLQRPAAAPPTPAPAQQGARFGMEAPQAAPAGLDEAIARAFALPT